jgi:peptidoglycan/LPS O-acetylase OafA/YrhL
MKSYVSLFILTTFIAYFTYRKRYKIPDISSFHSFNLDATLSLRGFLAILIVCHHVGQGFNRYPIGIFGSFGSAIVASFFLISGYGLMVSYLRKGNAYLDNFLLHRFSKLLPLFLILNLFSVGFLHFIVHITISDIIIRLRQGYPPLPNSWFMYIIICLYLIFYYSCKYSHTKRQCIILSSLLSFALIAILQIANFKGWWYVSIPSFIIGLIIAGYETKIQTFYIHHSKAILSALCIILGISAVCRVLELPPNPFNFAPNVCPVILLFTIYTFGMYSNKITRYCGKISLEIYLVHGMFLYWLLPHFHLSWIPYTLVTFALTIPTADILHRFNNKIVSYLE